MPSIQDFSSGFTPSRQMPSWIQDGENFPRHHLDHQRLSAAQTETLRPMESSNVQTASRPYLPTRPSQHEPGQQRQQLPGLQELLSPPVRTGPPSSLSGNWSSINSKQPTTWQDGPPPSMNLQPTHNRRQQIPFTPTPPPFHRLSLSSGDHFKQPPPNPNNPAVLSQNRPSLPVPPSRNLSELPGLRAPDQLAQPVQNGELVGPHQQQTQAMSFRDSFSDNSDRRSSVANLSRNHSAASNYSLQCVGQRHIPGEGMCYVFKDGSTCPTVIDGEPVNPLWGTTKAGKARKRLAQACLNCREKKIKCEPGEVSCLQCEKAKRECHRYGANLPDSKMATDHLPKPSAPQLKTDLLNSVAMSVSNPPSGHAEWSSQSSSSAAMTDLQTQKRRRSAQVAQQDALNPPHNWNGERSPRSLKRRKSDCSMSSADEVAVERQRKDSKRVDVDDLLVYKPQSQDSASWDEDPFHVDPDGTIRFLELFFAQSAREVHLMFPRSAFTRWVRNCREKCQSECMVLYALLALGSVFAGDEHSSFAKLCSERAGQAVSRIDGRFSMSLVQARLLVAAYYHLIGKDSMGWDLSGLAFRVIGAMRLNTEEGCEETVDECTRSRYSFTHEQLQECRRRTFWTAFLVDRYHGFCGGLLCTIQPEDIRLRLPCVEQTYEDGYASDAPFFDYYQLLAGAQSRGSSLAQNPSAYTIAAASLWGDVTRLIHRSPRQLVQAKRGFATYEQLVDEVQFKLQDWKSTLPRHLDYSHRALIEAVQHGYAGSMVMMHVVYHTSQLKVARHSHLDSLPPSKVARHIRAANSHALQLLEIVCDLRSTKSKAGSGPGQDPTNLLSPFFAYGITAAIDTLTAGGLKEDFSRLMDLLSGGASTLYDLALFCASAKTQAKQASQRMAQVELQAAECFRAASRATVNDQEKDGFWRIAEPMDKQLPLLQDVTYGVQAEIYLSALRDGR